MVSWTEGTLAVGFLQRPKVRGPFCRAWPPLPRDNFPFATAAEGNEVDPLLYSGFYHPRWVICYWERSRSVILVRAIWDTFVPSTTTVAAIMNRYRNAPGMRGPSKASPTTQCQKCLQRDM